MSKPCASKIATIRPQERVIPLPPWRPEGRQQRRGLGSSAVHVEAAAPHRARKAEFGHVGRAQIGKERTEPLQPRRDIWRPPGAAGLGRAGGRSARGPAAAKGPGSAPSPAMMAPRAHPHILPSAGL